MFYIIDDLHYTPSFLYAYCGLSPHRGGGGQETDALCDAVNAPGYHRTR